LIIDLLLGETGTPDCVGVARRTILEHCERPRPAQSAADTPPQG
jgi:hypothetical protein